MGETVSECTPVAHVSDLEKYPSCTRENARNRKRHGRQRYSEYDKSSDSCRAPQSFSSNTSTKKARICLMPLYDFECLDCRHFFEAEHPRNVPNPPCPLCAGKTEKRLSPPPIIFKGGGFYKTDSGVTSRTSAPSAQEEPDHKPKESHKDTVAETPKKEPADTKREDKTAPPKTNQKH